MHIKEVTSHAEMLASITTSKRSYVLLYKKGSDASDCSYKMIAQAIDEIQDIIVLAADVAQVRDIHGVYKVESAPSLLVFEGAKYIKTIKGCNDEGFYKSLFESALFKAKSTDSKSQKRVTVYSTPSCSWCTTLKTHLKKHGITFTEIDVSKDEKAAEAMVRRSGQQGVPQTDIDGKFIVGFDKTRINSLLGINN